MANDLISRKALIAEYDRVHIGPPGGARKLMEDAPTVDAEEVVRCKDCDYFEKEYRGFGFCKYFDIGRADNDFCSSCIRREGE